VERKKTAVTVRVAPFHPLPAAAVAEVRAEGERLLEFLEPDAPNPSVRFEPIG
jgi:hypothetical protein